MSNVIQQINPQSYTFVLKEPVLFQLDTVVINYENAHFSYLADQIFDSDGNIVELMVAKRRIGNISRDFITISKNDRQIWSEQERADVQVLTDNIVAEYGDLFKEENLKGTEFEPKTRAQNLLKQIFDLQVNPVVAEHNGKIKLIDVSEEPDQPIDAVVEMTGQCGGCNSSTTQTLAAIKEIIAKEFSKASVGASKPLAFGQIIVLANNIRQELRV